MTEPVAGLGISCQVPGDRVQVGSSALRNGLARRPTPRSDRQQLDAARGIASPGSSGLGVADLKLSEPPMNLIRAKPETGLRPGAHALPAELARVLIDPSPTQPILLGYFCSAERCRLKALRRPQCLEFRRDEARKTSELRFRQERCAIVELGRLPLQDLSAQKHIEGSKRMQTPIYGRPEGREPGADGRALSAQRQPPTSVHAPCRTLSTLSARR
jgi:hypothetical protein